MLMAFGAGLFFGGVLGLLSLILPSRTDAADEESIAENRRKAQAVRSVAKRKRLLTESTFPIGRQSTRGLNRRFAEQLLTAHPDDRF